MADTSERPPGAAMPLVYKPRPLLEPDERLLAQMQVIGGYKVSQEEAAALLGVSRDTLRLFWEKHPEYREHYEAGRTLRRVKVRRLLDMHAITDAGTARFLAKNELGLSDDPSKAKADEAAAREANKRMSGEEAKQ